MKGIVGAVLDSAIDILNGGKKSKREALNQSIEILQERVKLLTALADGGSDAFAEYLETAYTDRLHDTMTLMGEERLIALGGAQELLRRAEFMRRVPEELRDVTDQLEESLQKIQGQEEE